MKHAGVPTALVNERRAAGTLMVSGAEDGIRLSLTIDSGSSRLIVREARHDGAGDTKTARVLDALCAIIVGRPLQEAADHGVIYVMAALPADCAPIVGIRTPRNAGPAFTLAERLVRQAHAAARQHFDIDHRENAWYLRPDTDWVMKDEAARVAVIKSVVTDFLRTQSLGEDDIFLSRIERGTRVTVGFASTVTYAMKPKLMLALEQQLRRETGNPLELFVEEMKDANKIRRL